MTLYVPSHYNEKPLRQVKIMPSTVPTEFIWQCPSCKNLNTTLKRDFSPNKSYSCWDCKYTWAAAIVPDDIRHFLQDTQGIGSINQRPRIVRQ